MKQLYQKFISIKLILLLINLFIGLKITAQTTSIPDQNFEQHLIDEGIDSDGTINGQVLTSDIVSVLVLDLYMVNDLTGLEDFTALESLEIWDAAHFQNNNDITLDLTANVNLEKIEIWTYEGLKNLDLTGLVNLEELWVMEGQDDVVTMYIEEIDLSTNPNIKYLHTGYLQYLEQINFQNGNNIYMLDMEITVENTSARPICLKVDNATAATNNNSPYDNWTMYGVIPNYYDTGVCTLAADIISKIEVSLFPNPVQNSFQIKTSDEIERVQIFSIDGKEVAYFGSQSEYDISQLPTGMYFVKIQSNKGEAIQRIVKR
ncbi:T9SS type A sorting domain-containing protein [Mesonia sp. K4-1]|uniref:T9SS type A sorting domain-containing protein n=1 Tax=Mesonia sp. K4-1 TaxID=2602760 RepID=UPI0011C8E0C8|nr:T9SS type A sorting domain-containing protein [Mesonia sp. K4-1]TXK77242.1 T9SS type A sorting domain-containing protein [Mesonia sp. K4-1]